MCPRRTNSAKRTGAVAPGPRLIHQAHPDGQRSPEFKTMELQYLALMVFCYHQRDLGRIWWRPPLLFWARPFTFIGSAAGKPMNHDNHPASYIRGILNTVKTIAMVGISPKDV